MERLELKTLLVDVLTEIKGESPTPLDESLALQDDLKLDSIDVISLAIEMRERIGVTIDPAEATGLVTVGDLLSLLQAKLIGLPARAA